MTWDGMGAPDLLRRADDFHQYAYGAWGAVELAARLGLPAVTLIELGVAGGNGLVELERLALELESERGIAARVAGFDLGTGMPAPTDHRDSPYVWQQGFFRMDEAALRARLVRADLLLGDVVETGSAFLASSPPPIGFISFDLDYYSSTAAAFGALLESTDYDRYLPRVLCYFDDTVGPHAEMHSEFTGELLAIDEFNRRQASRKLARISGLRYKVQPCDGPWIDGMFVLHLFDHPLYNTYVFPDADRQFPLDPSGSEEDGPAI